MAEITFGRSDEQAMLASTLRDLLASTVDMDRTRELSLTTDALDRPVWRALGELGLIGLHLPEAHGGAASPFTDVAVVFEETGRVVAAVPLLSTLMASSAIHLGGSDAQHAAWLPDLASGEAVGTCAFFEGRHDDARTPATTAAVEDDGYRITGTKRFVPDAVNADVFVVSASLDGGLSLFVVPAGSAGVDVRATSALDPTRPLAEVVLDVVVSDEHRLAEAPAAGVLGTVLDRGIVALAAEQVGGADHCLRTAVEYAGSRYQFGRAIGSFQAIKHRCADMLVAVEHARSTAWHAAATIDDADEAAVMVPVARSVCSDAFVRVAGDAIQVFGGIGFTWEHDAHLYFKRAKADSLILGSVGASRDRLAAAIGA